MSSLDEVLGDIESPRFSALANVASDLKTFLRAVEQEPASHRLLALLRSEEVVAALARRMECLVGEPGEPSLEHPHDAALAAYLWALRGEPTLGRQAALAVQSAPRCWWARKVAEKILAEQTETNGPALDAVADSPCRPAAK
jgi:hypothetical protein